jgi:hypothetical protein
MNLRAAKEEDANQYSVPLVEVKRMLGLYLHSHPFRETDNKS